MLQASVVAALLYPAFLLVPGLVPSSSSSPCRLRCRLVHRAAGSLYQSAKPDSARPHGAAGLVSGVGPLAVGLLAQRYGLAWALAGLALAPVCLLGALRRPRGQLAR